MRLNQKKWLSGRLGMKPIFWSVPSRQATPFACCGFPLRPLTGRQICLPLVVPSRSRVIRRRTRKASSPRISTNNLERFNLRTVFKLFHFASQITLRHPLPSAPEQGFSRHPPLSDPPFKHPAGTTPVRNPLPPDPGGGFSRRICFDPPLLSPARSATLRQGRLLF